MQIAIWDRIETTIDYQCKYLTGVLYKHRTKKCHRFLVVKLKEDLSEYLMCSSTKRNLFQFILQSTRKKKTKQFH